MLASIVSIYVSAQNFEGKITYDNHIQSKVSNVSDEQFTRMLGNTQEYYIKCGTY